MQETRPFAPIIESQFAEVLHNPGVEFRMTPLQADWLIRASKEIAGRVYNADTTHFIEVPSIPPYALQAAAEGLYVYKTFLSEGLNKLEVTHAVNRGDYLSAISSRIYSILTGVRTDKVTRIQINAEECIRLAQLTHPFSIEARGMTNEDQARMLAVNGALYAKIPIEPEYREGDEVLRRTMKRTNLLVAVPFGSNIPEKEILRLHEISALWFFHARHSFQLSYMRRFAQELTNIVKNTYLPGLEITGIHSIGDVDARERKKVHSLLSASLDKAARNRLFYQCGSVWGDNQEAYAFVQKALNRIDR